VLVSLFSQRTNFTDLKIEKTVLNSEMRRTRGVKERQSCQQHNNARACGHELKIDVQKNVVQHTPDLQCKAVVYTIFFIHLAS